MAEYVTLGKPWAASKMPSPSTDDNKNKSDRK
jgi:hypothetical protein